MICIRNLIPEREDLDEQLQKAIIPRTQDISFKENFGLLITSLRMLGCRMVYSLDRKLASFEKMLAIKRQFYPYIREFPQYLADLMARGGLYAYRMRKLSPLLGVGEHRLDLLFTYRK